LGGRLASTPRGSTARPSRRGPCSRGDRRRSAPGRPGRGHGRPGSGVGAPRERPWPCFPRSRAGSEVRRTACAKRGGTRHPLSRAGRPGAGISTGRRREAGQGARSYQHADAGRGTKQPPPPHPPPHPPPLACHVPTAYDAPGAARRAAWADPGTPPGPRRAPALQARTEDSHETQDLFGGLLGAGRRAAGPADPGRDPGTEAGASQRTSARPGTAHRHRPGRRRFPLITPGRAVAPWTRRRRGAGHQLLRHRPTSLGRPLQEVYGRSCPRTSASRSSSPPRPRGPAAAPRTSHTAPSKRLRNDYVDL